MLYSEPSPPVSNSTRGAFSPPRLDIKFHRFGGRGSAVDNLDLIDGPAVGCAAVLPPAVPDAGQAPFVVAVDGAVTGVCFGGRGSTVDNLDLIDGPAAVASCILRQPPREGEPPHATTCGTLAGVRPVAYETGAVFGHLFPHLVTQCYSMLLNVTQCYLNADAVPLDVVCTMYVYHVRSFAGCSVNSSICCSL